MEKTERDQAQVEYATQHFGYTPTCLIDDVTEDTLEILGSALSSMKQQVQKKQPGKCSKEDLDKAFEKVETKYKGTVEKLFEKLGTYLCENILVVPNQVLLPEDSVWDANPRGDAMSRLTSLNTDMETVRNKIKNALYKKAVLKNELENIKAVCSRQEAALQQEVDSHKRVGLDQWGDSLDFIACQRKILTRKKTDLVKTMADEKNAVLGERKVNNKRKMDCNVMELVATKTRRGCGLDEVIGNSQPGLFEDTP